jgi:hypothetical protein
VTGATSLAIDQGVGAVTGTSTSVSPSVTTSYTLTATNASGISTASVTVTVGALAQMNLPVTFDSATVAYGLLGFGGAEDSTIVLDPAGGTNKVAKVVKSATAELWAGTTLTADGTLGFASKIPFTASATKMTVRTYSPDVGIHVRLKVEDHTNAGVSVETEAITTVANTWETLTFDFANQAAGTAALDVTKSYDKASIFFNFGVTGATAGAKTYYFDDVAFAGGGSAPPVIASFTASPSTIAPGGSSVLAWSVTGATSLSIDQGVGTVTGTSTSVSPSVTTTYTLTATNASGSSTASATVTVGGALAQMDLPVTFDSPTVDYGLVGFGGAEDSTIVPDPTGGTNKVAKVVKSATAQTWAGTTMTTIVATVQVGFASKIPFTASATKMTVRTYSPDVGIHVRLKVEDHTNAGVSVETEAITTVANAWETLTFDFANQAAGTAALDVTKSYDKASIFFNFGVDGATAGAKTYYFDDVAFAGGGSLPPVIASFTASPSTIAPGGSSVLAWSVTGATSLSIDQGVGTVTGTSTSVSPSVTTTYTLTATNASGSSTATATVTVSSSNPLSALVFWDDYDTGVLPLAGFGGSYTETHPVTRDPTTTNNGRASLEMAVVTGDCQSMGGYIGGYIASAAPRDLHAYNALTFWAKSDVAATIDHIGFGNDNTATGTNAFNVESHGPSGTGFPLTSTWTQYFIPIPNPAALTSFSGLFYFSGGCPATTYHAWFNDIQFVTLSPSQLVSTFGALNAASTGAPATLAVQVGTPAPIANPGPNTINYASTAAYIVGWAYFTYATTDATVATVDSNGMVVGHKAGTCTLTLTFPGTALSQTINVTVTAPLAAPTTIATAPTVSAANAISLFSSTYAATSAAHGVDTWQTGWSAGNNEIVDPYVITPPGHNVKKYTLHNFVGIEFGLAVPANTVDATTMTTFHVDVWSPNPPTNLEIQLVDDPGGAPHVNAIGKYEAGTIATGTWVPLEIPLSSFTGLTSQNVLQQMLFVASGPTVIYVDNIYFHN